ncbi:MAG TPA: ADP-ribosylglycohydrolase family protein [Armatimonadota bacterium]|nr:ADP-ribosylglycohydrolase family protein [Armatimonadota bacterium]
MLGAIAGDMIGAPYEFDSNNIKTTDFPLFLGKKRSKFTDDSVLTVATAEAILTGGDYAGAYVKYFNLYPHAGYGTSFRLACRSGKLTPYDSYGNGSAMRVSPVGWYAETLEQALDEAKRSAEVSHNHPEGIKGAQATAAAIYLARFGKTKDAIRDYIVSQFGYNLSRTLDEIRPDYHHIESCMDTVPEAITAFLESDNFEDAVRKAVSLGGDSDTLTCITGGIAEAFYGGVPDHIGVEVWNRLDETLAKVVREFREKYCVAK